jgi:hypothetical protein
MSNIEKKKGPRFPSSNRNASRLETSAFFPNLPSKNLKAKPLSPLPSRLAKLSPLRRSPLFCFIHPSLRLLRPQWKLSRAQPPPPSSQPTTVLLAWPRSRSHSARAPAGSSARPPPGLAAARKTFRLASLGTGHPLSR